MGDFIYWLSVLCIGLVVYRIMPKFVIGSWPVMAMLRDLFIAFCIGGVIVWLFINIVVKGS